jgi:hypothetical protein
MKNIDDMTPEELRKQLQFERGEKEKAIQEAENMKDLAAEKGAITKIDGTFKAKVKVEGKEVTKTYAFADGTPSVRNADQDIVPTQKVLTLANGGSVSAEELKRYPKLQGMVTEDGKDNGACKSLLNYFAQIGAGFLVEQ